jgi:hypothetical protein
MFVAWKVENRKQETQRSLRSKVEKEKEIYGLLLIAPSCSPYSTLYNTIFVNGEPSIYSTESST